MINITQILEQAPSKIAEYAEKENEQYAKMITLHEQYKRMRAKQYLTLKATSSLKVKDIEYQLDCDSELNNYKDQELCAEIEYRAWRSKKEKAKDMFTMACELGYNKRAELRSLNDTITERS